MSKKKVTGNTMTLKDFHGGSIPTDLPLPSAPGVAVRTSDRSGFDRPSSWGNPVGRSDLRSRPHTSPATRHYDDKTPFLSPTAQIGRNFDEDERKPLDGVSAPRRTISDESIRVPSPRVEVKPEYGLGGSSSGQQVAPVSQTPVGNVNSYSARLTEAVHAGIIPQNLGGNREQGSGGIHPNVWAMRKEVASAVELDQSTLSAPDPVSKLAHASAIEKVSSGRWQSKTVHYQTEVDVARPSEADSGLRTNGNDNGNSTYNRMSIMGEKEYHDAMLARQAKKGSSIDDQTQVGWNRVVDYERSEVSKYSGVRPGSMGYHPDVVQPTRNDGKLGGVDLQNLMPSEAMERPKLNLLPRTKPLENPEVSVTDYEQECKRVCDSSLVETVNEVHGHANTLRPVSTGTDSRKEVGQRPKLNLKPRLQPIEQMEGNTQTERNTLFGGARPRELVLKERGIDDVVIKSYDMVEHSNRLEPSVGRGEKFPDHSTQTHRGEKAEDAIIDQRAGKKPERKDQRVDADRVNAHRRNWRGDNRRNTRETERQQVSERQRSPETWRKPVEQPKLFPNAAGQRYGKAASAVELAQTFSRSVSDPKTNERFPGQRGLNPGRTQVPFSRLVGPTTRPQINGY